MNDDLEPKLRLSPRLFTQCNIFLDFRYKSIFAFSAECVSWICCNQSHIAAPNLTRNSELMAGFVVHFYGSVAKTHVMLNRYEFQMQISTLENLIKRTCSFQILEMLWIGPKTGLNRAVNHVLVPLLPQISSLSRSSRGFHFENVNINDFIW